MQLIIRDLIYRSPLNTKKTLYPHRQAGKYRPFAPRPPDPKVRTPPDRRRTEPPPVRPDGNAPAFGRTGDRPHRCKGFCRKPAAPARPFPGSAVRRIPRNSVRHTTPFRSRHPRPAPDAEPQNATKPCRPERIPFSTTQPFTYTGNRLHTGVRQSGCRTLPQ